MSLANDGHQYERGALVKIGQRKRIHIICVLAVAVIAWGYAGWSWLRKDGNRTFVPRPAADSATAAAIHDQPANSTDDFLPPVELRPELTPDEEAAVKRIARLVSIGRKELPRIDLVGEAPAPTNAEILKQYSAWIHDLYCDSFQRYAKDGASWRSDAAQWLEDCLAHSLDRERRPALREAGQRLIDGGCDDWLIRYCLFRCQDGIDQPEQAARAVSLLQPLDSLATSAYPPTITYRIYFAHAEAMSRISPGQPVGLKQAMDGFAAAISEPLSEEERRFFALRFRSEMRGLFEQHLGQLVGRLEAAPTADRWFVRLVEAIWHIERGWQFRGGDYAGNVTEEGWSGFDAHLRKARALLLQCWDEHPECPEAAGELIRVTIGMGGIAGESPRFWFDEAVGAQFDYRGAYERLRWALWPRWGGSHGEMLAFGRECLATARFDTDVPWQLHLVLKEIGSEIEDRRDVYRLPDVYEDYQKLLAGYRQRDAGTPALARQWDSRAACVAWLAGRKDEAKTILDRLGNDVAVEAFTDFDTTIGEVRRDLQGLERSALAQAPFLPGVEFVSIAQHGHAVMVGSVFSGAKIADTRKECEITASLVPAERQGFRGYCLSPDGATLVTVPMSLDDQAGTLSVMLWDVATQAKLREWTVPGGAFLATFSPDGQYVAVAGMGGSVSIWDASSERATPVAQGSGHSGFLCGLDFSADGSRLVTIGADGRASVWDLSKGSSQLDLALSDSITIGQFVDGLRSVSLSPDGQQLLVGGDSVVLWDVATKEKLLTLTGACGDFAPDGQRLVTGGGKLGSEARVWDAKTGEELLKLQGGHAYAVSVAVFSNDGRRIVTGETNADNMGESGFVRCWDAETGDEVFDFSGLK